MLYLCYQSEPLRGHLAKEIRGSLCSLLFPETKPLIFTRRSIHGLPEPSDRAAAAKFHINARLTGTRNPQSTRLNLWDASCRRRKPRLAAAAAAVI